jgi:hypothetical protein
MREEDKDAVPLGSSSPMWHHPLLRPEHIRLSWPGQGCVRSPVPGVQQPRRGCPLARCCCSPCLHLCSPQLSAASDLDLTMLASKRECRGMVADARQRTRRATAVCYAASPDGFPEWMVDAPPHLARDWFVTPYLSLQYVDNTALIPYIVP